jgi:hypothetical protein
MKSNSFILAQRKHNALLLEKGGVGQPQISQILTVHAIFLSSVSLFIYLFNFAIIMHSWQGHHNSMVPITVGPLNR